MEIINVTNNNLFSNSVNDISIIRTNDDNINRYENSETNLERHNGDDDDLCNDELNVNIYRFKFTTDFTDELYKFSKIHQYDHRKDFKEAWEIWVEANGEIVNEEVRRLNSMGYAGDIIDKMFKSARYYFRKKSTEKKQPIKRRVYVGSQKDMLEAMDAHITRNIKETTDFKPSNGFDDFCKLHVDILAEQVNMLCRAGITDSNEIKSKIKKTYKNRYFIIANK